MKFVVPPATGAKGEEAYILHGVGNKKWVAGIAKGKRPDDFKELVLQLKEQIDSKKIVRVQAARDWLSQEAAKGGKRE